MTPTIEQVFGEHADAYQALAEETFALVGGTPRTKRDTLLADLATRIAAGLATPGALVLLPTCGPGCPACGPVDERDREIARLRAQVRKQDEHITALEQAAERERKAHEAELAAAYAEPAGPQRQAAMKAERRPTCGAMYACDSAPCGKPAGHVDEEIPHRCYDPYGRGTWIDFKAGPSGRHGDWIVVDMHEALR